MGFWKNLFQNKIFQGNIFQGGIFSARRSKKDAQASEDKWDEITLRRGETDMDDPEQRMRYIKGCLEQMAESADATEKLSGEYNSVTAYLTDMEEIEALPPQEAQELKDNAKAVVSLDEERRRYASKPGRMSDSEFHHIECIEEGIEEGIRKIRAAEKYQELVRKDLKRLNAERHAFQYRKNDLKATLENTKGMAVICAVAVAACFSLMLVLQFGFGLDAKIGYLITAAAGALTVTLIDMKHLEAKKELKKVGSSMNKLIILQNHVKIRYVNNTNLLEYYYLKYNVTKGSELEEIWEKYQEERQEREKFKQTSVELDFYQRELLKQLNRLPIQDPYIWLHQPEAIIDQKEMVEIRHGLIGRRQKLRSQFDYNRSLAEKAQEEIKSIVAQYPQYAKEILGMVEKYDVKVQKNV